jgi:hypothetical protein
VLAAAVIPAPIAYIKVVAVKARQHMRCSKIVSLSIIWIHLNYLSHEMQRDG